MPRSIFEDTDKFSGQLLNLINLPLFDDSQRFLLSHVACSISLEHWAAILNLLKSGMLPSAAIIHRAQLEALLRSIWILHSASEDQLSRLANDLTIESEQNARNLPQAAEMMFAIEKTAPPQAYEALNRFKINSWKALNSYVHAGIHPMRRHAGGYPILLIESILKNANWLAVLAAMQAAVLSGIQPLQSEILAVAARYPHCIPSPYDYS